MKLSKDLNIALRGRIYPVTLKAGKDIADVVRADQVEEVTAIALAAGCIKEPAKKKA